MGGKPTEFVKDPDLGLWEAEESGSPLGVWIAQPSRWMVMPFADTEMLGWEQVREENKNSRQSQVRNVRNSKKRYELSLKPHPLLLFVLPEHMGTAAHEEKWIRNRMTQRFGFFAASCATWSIPAHS